MIFIKLLSITVILVMGLKIAMSDKMLLEKLGKFFERKIEEGYKIYDLFYCQWCMGSLQSIVAHGFAFGLGILPFEFNWQLVWRYPLLVMASSLIDGLIWTVYLTINEIKDRNEEHKIFYYRMNISAKERENNEQST